MRFLNKVAVLAITTSDLERQAKKILQKFFQKDHLPVPKFRIVNNPSSKWLARTIYNSEFPDTTMIEVQRRALIDPVTLEKVLTHEICHSDDFMLHPQDQKKTGYDPHGKFFQENAKRINRTKGKDFVTKLSDRTYILDKK